MKLLVLVSAIVLAIATPATAAAQWVAEELPGKADRGPIVPLTLKPAPSGIEDMRMTQAKGDIVAAWYAEPTTRYAHGVLGDAVEGGALVVRLADGRRSTLRLPVTEVFEDLYPRIADLDGDGRNEVVTIRSSLLKGGAVTIYGLSGEIVEEKASTPFIGRPNRWLNIAGIARFSGGVTPEIAFVATPHIGGVLAFLKYRDGKLAMSQAVPGYSNHAIGSRELRLSAIADVNGDGAADLAVPTADRKALAIVSFKGGKIEEIGRAGLPAAIDRDIGVEKAETGFAFLVGLENGRKHRIAAR
jgi:hypothetical protein